MGRLTTHVLDTTRGTPAAGMKVELVALDDSGGEVAAATIRTNADGRCERPLLQGETFRAGTWELRFHVGSYFAAQGDAAGDVPFLDVVPVRFRLPADGHFHVPLLVTPWSYSTYRGS